MTANYIIPFVLFLSFTTALDIDYYWKDYYGAIPDDAFVAVQNKDGTPAAYIAQAFVKNLGIFPALLYPNETSVTMTSGGINSVVSNNLKILATRRLDCLKWVEIHYSDIASVNKIDFIKIVEGGFESDEKMYIGRHIHEGKMQIGKVYNVVPYQGLTLPNKEDGRTTLYKEFEILLYVSNN